MYRSASSTSKVSTWGIKDRYEAIWIGDREVCDVMWSDVDIGQLVRTAPSAPPLILDFSRVDNQQESVSTFLTPLWKASAGGGSPYLIVLDEADRVVPRSGPRLEVAFEIAVRGRKRGLGLMVCTQRPSQVDQDIIGQCTLQMVGRLLLEADLRAVGPFFGKEKADGLADLGRGRFWVLGEGRPSGELVAVRARETSHKSETPELSINRRARPSEEVLAAIRARRLAATGTAQEGEVPIGAREAVPRLPPKDRLAVLPFVSIGVGEADDFFADGMTEELIARLSQVRGLRVIARTSAMHYKGTRTRVSEIGRELQVGALLEGSVRKSGQRIRVTAQLVDTATEEHLWSETFDRDLQDIFAIQDEVAARIAEALPGNLLPDATIHPAGTKSRNVEAYTLFLQAKHLASQRSADGLRQALVLLRRATAMDPAFARAFAFTANCHVYQGYIGQISWPDTIAAAKEAAHQALRLDPNLADAHSVAAEIAWLEDDFSTTEQEATRAVELNPSLSSAYHTLGYLKLMLGYPREGTRLVETASKLDPLWPLPLLILGQMYVYFGRDREALSVWERALPLSPLDVSRSLAYYHLGKREIPEALRMLSSMEASAPDNVRTLDVKGNLAAGRGDRDAAMAVIRRMNALLPAGGSITRSSGSSSSAWGTMTDSSRRCGRQRGLTR